MVGNLHGHKVGIVTCANDTMRDFASIWLRALLSTGCKLPVYVIPFDGGTDYISKLCEHNGVHLLPNEEDRWVSLGREIYGEEEYRHGVKRSLYFSKLRAFDTPLDTIIYMDINAIPFENPEKLLPSFLSSGKDILFEFQVSGIGRNISRVRIHNQNMTTAANAHADRKTFGHLS